MITDAAPYVCNFIPEQAFRVASGITGPLPERTTGSKENGECRIPHTTNSPLQVNWLQADGRNGREHLNSLIEGRQQIYVRHGGVRLPADLGDGMAAYLSYGLLAQEPYRVSAKFRCGEKERMLDIHLSRITKGRDGLQDLIALMRIAQKRYGELYGCTPKGA